MFIICSKNLCLDLGPDWSMKDFNSQDKEKTLFRIWILIDRVDFGWVNVDPEDKKNIKNK